MNIFSIFIFKGRSKELKELESWTVSWEVSISLRWSTTEIFNKVFISKEDAISFKAELEITADFLGTPIHTEIKKN